MLSFGLLSPCKDCPYIQKHHGAGLCAGDQLDADDSLLVCYNWISEHNSDWECIWCVLKLSTLTDSAQM